MKKILIFIVAQIFMSNLYAQTLGEKQANEFKAIYYNNCMQYLNNLDDLRLKFKNTPSLPAQKAKSFLQQYTGKAYPISDKSGLFVLAIPDKTSLCSVHARHLDIHKAKKDFIKFLSQASKPLLAKQIKIKKTNSEIESLAYEWSIEGAPSKMVFMLTVTPNRHAARQALFTASLSRDTPKYAD